MPEQNIAPTTNPISTLAIQYEEKVKRARRDCFTLCLFAVLACLLSFVGALILDPQHLSLWFQRSGAIMTVPALLAQNKANNLRYLLTPNSFSTSEFNNIIFKYRKSQGVGNLSSLSLIIIGTLIWGYGDLL